ncbi:MAG: hypothetical protein ACRDCB_10240 [Clostridium sp.]
MELDEMDKFNFIMDKIKSTYPSILENVGEKSIKFLEESLSDNYEINNPYSYTILDNKLIIGTSSEKIYLEDLLSNNDKYIKMDVVFKERENQIKDIIVKGMRNVND